MKATKLRPLLLPGFFLAGVLTFNIKQHGTARHRKWWLAIRGPATALLGAIAALLPVAGLAQAVPTTTVQPSDNGTALVNPGMGWTMHYYSNVARNYGSRLTPADTLDDFPGLSTVYLRLPWAYLEPEEGKFNWAIFDTPAQRWIAKGKRIALRVTCSENWMTYATPKWVKNAGAKGVFYQYGKGRVEAGGAWDPFFDDPVFISKLDAFLGAYAKRYDGNMKASSSPACMRPPPNPAATICIYPLAVATALPRSHCR